MLYRTAEEFVCRADPSLDFGAWLDRLGIMSVSIDGAPVHTRMLTVTEQALQPNGDIVHCISAARPLTLGRLPRLLRTQQYRFATPGQYCRFLEVADALGRWMHLWHDLRLLLPQPGLLLHVYPNGKTVRPTVLQIELEGSVPRVTFVTKPHAMPMLDRSAHVLACPNGHGKVLSL